MGRPIQTSFDDMGIPLREVTFVVVDLETTGGSPSSSSITEVGAARYQGGEEVASFQTLVDPGEAIPPFITILTGITHSMVTGAPRIESVLPALLEFMGDAVIVGHNLRFDLSFLDSAATKLGYEPVSNRTVDTVALARRLVRPEVRNLKLSTLAAHFRSPVKPTHRALADARATAHVLWGLLERAGTLGVTALDDLLALPTARGSSHYRKIHLADDLPRRPGVYLFRDRDGTVMYIGKASNLRGRVRSYFYGDQRKSVANILRELVEVDYRVCETPLEAEITELRLIWAHRPRHNRRSRPPRSTHFVKLTDEAYPRLSIVRTLRPEGSYLGPFRSRRAATDVMTALWDATPIRRCTHRPGSREAACAAAQLGVALCPCDGSLSAADYEPVATLVRTAIEHDPRLVLEPLAERVGRLAGEQRFEEAAEARDRHRALARALERRRAWQSFQVAGVVELEDSEGQRVVIDRGRFVNSWRSGGSPPLRPVSTTTEPTEQVPPDVLAAEEARLLWRWASSEGVRLIHTDGSLSSGAVRVPLLERLP